MSNAGHQGPTEELSNENRDMHQATASLMEELEAINNYNQRANACADKALKAIFEHNRDEEKEHAAMLLEWIRRQDPNFSSKLQTYLFSDKPITHSTAAD